jgi:hypothetical protein
MRVVVRLNRPFNVAGMPFAAAALHQLATAWLYTVPEAIVRIFDLVEVSPRPGPVARVHALAHALAVHFAVTPDRAGTLRVSAALGSMRACFQMPAP